MFSRISLLLLTSLFCVAEISQAAEEKPNIVFFFIDDLGWADVNYTYDFLKLKEETYYETPAIDKLASESLIFTDAYANAPNCAPSRACLMSGQYSPRHGIYTVGNPKRGNHKQRKLEPTPNETVLGDQFITIAESLKTNGYTSASMGKWHLGADPKTQGFDVNIAGKEWGSPSGGGYHSPFKYPNLIIKEKGVYLTDAITTSAVDFIESNQNKPFFLYLTHYAVHTPIQGKESLTKHFKTKQSTPHQKNAQYAAMLKSVDESVDAVLQTLTRLNLDENTIIVFFSDNGGHEGATSNYPLRGAKGMLYEGGIREPLLIKWPGVTKAGDLCDEPVIGIDLYPTFLAMTNTTPPTGYTLDGVSLVPLLKDSQASLDRKAIFWHFPAYLQGKGDPHGGPFRTTPAGAIRMGDWKLIEWFETGRLELYNLKADLSETNNLAESQPEHLRRLHTQMKLWRKEVNAPIPTTPNPQYNPQANSR
ncbi:MAG: sulfatase [Planctomycetaceae bacterium]|jgi:arylsulfatase A-like enzyme|nr:sulfatase [Planctomycetaceae bacterium]